MLPEMGWLAGLERGLRTNGLFMLKVDEPSFDVAYFEGFNFHF